MLSPGYNKPSHLTVFPCKSTLLVGWEALKIVLSFTQNKIYKYMKKQSDLRKNDL